MDFHDYLLDGHTFLGIDCVEFGHNMGHFKPNLFLIEK